MLNIIWAGLIIISIVFAAGHDIHDEINNTYGNGQILQASYSWEHPGNRIKLEYNRRLIPARLKHREIIIPVDSALPQRWQRIAERLDDGDDKHIRASLIEHDTDNQQLVFTLPEVHWVKIKAITQAAFDMAEFAVKLAIGLAGIMALWLGLMQIAEKSGLIYIFVRLIQPLLHWLFPQIPRNHPVLGSISLNLAANVLGLGNAATPLGIRAMQQLQELNRNREQASDAMCMFLALNTSSVQLLPPVTLIALMGTGVSELMLPIVLATTASTFAAIVAVKLYMKKGAA